ncbi:MAG TPA: hypothetical protein VG734_13205 [Lacunisphaera sp.]|nr:hypothetical protein [Lacunisphaera sp.]
MLHAAVLLWRNSILSGFLLFSPMLSLDGRAADGPDLAALNENGLAAHRQRSLNEASRHYRELLKLDPPAEPSAAQRALVFRFAPRIHTVAGEFFPLKDVVAILHPDRPVIGYRLFWEDDIGYPSDNDPCDHEIVWVEYDPVTLKVVRVSAYFHGEILAPPAAVAEANTAGGRPWIGTEWGFHGSVPWGGMDAATPTLRRHWEQAHAGRPGPADPLARGWPERYAGSYEDYVKFSEPVDPRRLLEAKGIIWVSRWPMATLNRYSLRYNVAVKADWPWTAGGSK